MGIDERADEDEGAENAPQPESACSETVAYISALQFTADSVGDLVAPNERDNTESKPRKNKEDQAIVHCFLAIVSACDRIDVCTYGRHYNKTINAKGNDRQKNILFFITFPVVCSSRSDRRCRVHPLGHRDLLARCIPSFESRNACSKSSHLG